LENKAAWGASRRRALELSPLSAFVRPGDICPPAVTSLSLWSATVGQMGGNLVHNGEEDWVAIRRRAEKVDDLADSELVGRATAGSVAAFEALYVRHAPAAWRVAQAVTSNREDAADSVSVAFTNLLEWVARGRLGAEVPFRPYLFAATRNAAIDHLRHRLRAAPGDVELIEPSEPGERLVEGADAVMVAAAFRTLPERWRSVLWLTEVEDMPARQVGERLGLSPNAAAQLALRARKGLREQFLQAHATAAANAECRRIVERLGAYSAGALGKRAATDVEAHLGECATCRDRLAELDDVGTSLRRILVPLPLALGAAALTRYKLAFAAGRAAAFASAAWTNRAVRPLAIVNSGVLFLGVIAAAVVGSGGSPHTVAGGGLPRAATGTQAGPVVGTLPVQLAAAPPPAPTAIAFGFAQEAAGPAPPVPPARPVTATGGGRKPPPGPSPVVQASAGANLGVTTVAAGAGTGPGSCTDVSVGGGGGCGKPPSSPGAYVSVQSPAGSTSIGV